MKIRDLLRENIKNFKPYSSARDDYTGKQGIFIDANENSIGSVSNVAYNRYPDPHQKELKQKIAEIKQVDSRQIFLGNGSDEAIDLVFRAFCEPGKDKAIILSPTYGMYSVCANLNDVGIIDVPLNDEFQIDLKNLRSKLDQAKLIFICSPNNPSANAMAEEDVKSILHEFNGLVILDEAYQDFSSKKSWLTDISNYKNLVVLQTFSKAWGMAGLRLGMAFADPEIISVLSAIKYPYNLSELVQKTVLTALDNVAAKDKMVREILIQRKELLDGLAQVKSIKRIYPTDANFVLVQFPDAKFVYDNLVNEKIIVRDRSSLTGCVGCLRITVGTKEENEILIKTLKEITK